MIDKIPTEVIQSTTSYVSSGALAGSAFIIEGTTILQFSVLVLAVVIGAARAYHDILAAYRKKKHIK